MGSALVTGLKGLGRNWKPLLVIGLLLGDLAVPIVLLFGSFYLSALSEGVIYLAGILLLLLGPMFQLIVVWYPVPGFQGYFRSG